ncbi:MAG: biosynthetic-type acetolactate synthase large subunit [Gammaproteobacteria bacterium]|uniref:Acetolactate synthase n=1 Tax=Candidatus Thiopontia autotrophica TaxID=2841688 RepID=A0A8J6P7U4_9GAMM|nr:biosynthetic-type acetolactate synthase large subunit [Candidatus Thiopontia autotrophica]MBL6968942.1 biosynthetic-type acetolactate synthase large subunit [Gammaproteobacteria bacterium]
MELSGAEVITHFLRDEGVEYIFGYPGGAVLHIYDAIYRQDDVKHVLTRHEQGAVHAADGYARSSGKPGVVLVTSGPGATNAVTGIATAYMDSIPLVVITGQVPTPLIGNDAFQEVDTVGITRSCVKHNFLVTNVDDLAITLKKAFTIATTGRPGPVVIDVPKDVSGFKTEYSYPESVEIRSYQTSIDLPDEKIKQAVEMMVEAEKPVLYTGGGVILGNASDELKEVAQRLRAPVTNTTMGLGGYPATDPQFIGMLGMHGNYEANMAMHNTDLLIAVGARFDDRVTGNIEKFCPQAKIIHIDVDPSSISKNVQVDMPIVGDVKKVLSEIVTILQQQPEKKLASWWGEINEWRKEDCLAFDNSGGVIHPQFVLQTLYEVTHGDAYVVSDVGQHQMFAAQYYKFDKPRHWINSGGLGTMGFGLPAAMGAQFAHPDATVCTVTGDGSIQMNIQELATCQEFSLPLKIINLNNGYLGMVRQWQEFFYERRYSEVTLERNHQPDFVKLAESYGHVGMQIRNPDDVRGALEEALAMRDRLVFMDFITNPEENVYPMVPAGAGLNEMILI